MACPAVGAIVADIMDGRCEDKLRKVLRWRPEISVNRDWWAAQGRYGGDGVTDFRDVSEWTT